MPIVTRLPDEEAAFMDRLRALRLQRPPGFHVTDAIWCNIAATVKPALAAAGVEVRYSDATILRFAEGVMWEKALIKGDWHQQRQVASPEDESLGTFDAVLPRTWFPIEAKTTKRSTLADLPDSTLTQLGEYAARLMLWREREDGKAVTTWEGRIRTLHKDGDCGKNKCPEHGYPEEVKRRLNPESNRQKQCCPVCEGWLTSDRQPEVRFHKIVWTRDELLSLHKLLTWRLAELKADREAYKVSLSLPDWKWGYPQTECAGCEVQELIGCQGSENIDEMEAEMTGSIFELERETV